MFLINNFKIKDFIIKIIQEDYDNIINYWGNTVLSTLIAKGKVLV